jgi:hypothetical protein
MSKQDLYYEMIDKYQELEVLLDEMRDLHADSCGVDKSEMRIMTGAFSISQAMERCVEDMELEAEQESDAEDDE